MIACERCGKRLPVDVAGVIRCTCGHRFSTYQVQRLPCVYKGVFAGYADCGCQGNTAVYQCGIRSLCMDRKLKPGKVKAVIGGNKQCVEMAYCNDCTKRLEVAKTVQVNNAAIITTHYNPAGFNRLRETWLEWQPTIGEVITMELAIGNEPEIPGSVVISGDAGNILWQKERLINLAIEQLPAEIDIVAWVDHDIVFEDSQWLVKSNQIIESGVDCVQPFTGILYQDLQGKVIRKSTGAASVALAGGSPDTGPGAVWVASRDWLAKIGGLYDRNIVGGGDAVLFEAISGQRTRYRERQSPRSRDHLDRWIESVGPVRYACLPGTIRHLWHGDFANRQYVSRDAIMRQYDYDPERHITIDSRGLLAWTDAAPQAMRDSVAAYFAGRKEDG
jgi:hypothetical protein